MRKQPPSLQSRGVFLDACWKAERKGPEGMTPPGLGVRLPVLLRLQTGEDLLSGDRMLADANAAGVVDSVRQGSRYSADRRLTEALGPVEPAWLQAVDEDLRLACGHIHDRRNPVG